MDPIRLLLSFILGMFPRLLHLTAIPLAVVPRMNSRQQLRDYAIGHDWLGWYRVTLEVRAVGWPTLRVIAVSDWSRFRPGRKNRADDKSQSPSGKFRRTRRNASVDSSVGKRRR
jgi:hypothetical protein